ncbi:MAG TPA: lactonase family protein [Rhizobiaceae bacterium]|nr:lactonase family protein [Rhizobiaceae bacterium]
MSRCFAYVGCCNRPTPYFASSNGKGIAVFTFDTATGEMQPAGVREGIDNPTFLSVAPSGRHLYANSEVFGWNEGTVSAYAIDAATGDLSYLDKQPALGSITAFNSFDRSGRHLLVANYGMGPVSEKPNRSVAVFPIAGDGTLGPASAHAGHEGAGPDPDRQERPHAHAARISLDNRFVLVSDLGIDAIVVYRFDEASGSIVRSHACPLPAGSGPRHFVFDNAGARVFVVNELNSTVCSFAYDARFGQLRLIDTRATIPEGTGGNHCSEITLAPSGQRLFVANRGHDSIATLAIDPQTGRLHFEGTTPAVGKTPRHMAVDPSGRFLIVANQDSDCLSAFRIGEDGEKLSHVGSIATGTPTCIAFAPAPNQQGGA